MKSSTKYVEEQFPEADEITKIMLSIAYMDGAIAKAKEVTAQLKEEILEMQEPDYGSIKEQFSEVQDV